ncbi:MAG: hypothetical protein PUB09_04555 [Firmicutes bacterium]|nr:hypothetical protein [Bacillota bacterium]
MNFEELMEYLDLEDAADFQYFEAMADMIESEEYIEQEALYQLFDGADNTMISELLNDFFEDIMGGLPEDSGEICSLLEQIKMCLTGLIMNAEDDSDIRRFTDEFHRFRNWYSEESEVELLPENGGAPRYFCLRDAITSARVERLGGDRFRYNFENAVDYELDSYTMSFSDLVAAEDDYNNGTIVFDKDDYEFGENLSMEEDRY